MIRIKGHFLAIVPLALLALGCTNSPSEVIEAEELSEPKTIAITVSTPDPEAKMYLQNYLELQSGLAAENESQYGQALTAMQKSSVPEISALAKRASLGVDSAHAALPAFTEIAEELVRTGKVEAQSLYKQYCPMAFDNEGAYWLSDAKDIKNPYFGNAMLECGETKEILVVK